MDSESLTIFCDGSCLNNGYPGAKGGFAVLVLKGADELHRYSSALPGGVAPTNQRAELMALQYAVNYCAESGVSSADIYTDSKYAIQVLTAWAGGWEARGWIKPDKRPVMNLDIVKPLFELWCSVKDNIRLHHVPAHTGGKDALSEGNKIVDALAHTAAEKGVALLR